MTKLRRRFSFGLAMRSVLVLFFCMIAVKNFAQERFVDGIVFDKHNNERLAEVNVVNSTTGRSAYNNLKGEFTINATIGDILVFSKQLYFNDTVKVTSNTSIAVYLKRAAVQMREVTIKDTILTPEQRLEVTKRDYNKIYGPLGDKDFLNTAPGGGVGIGIDAIYNAFSRSGRNAAHLRGLIQNDYYQNVIDYRYNRALVSRITGLKDVPLSDFMQKYRPGYYFVVEASDYEFISYIKTNYKRYLRRPKAFALPSLGAPSKVDLSVPVK